MKPYANLNEIELIAECLKNSRKAQHELYCRYGPRMKLTCMRYLVDKNMAEDVLNKGFLKVFTHLKFFKGSGSFEGWVRRIMIYESLDCNRSRKSVSYIEEDDTEILNDQMADHGFSGDYLLRLIDSLPLGYKTVFNLVEIDGFNHKEVASRLGIAESASRSQLAKAKQMLRNKLGNY